MRRPDTDPVDLTPATGTATGPTETVPGTRRGIPTSSTGSRPDSGDGDVRELPTHPSTTPPRRVPLAVIAGVDWVRLVGRP